MKVTLRVEPPTPGDLISGSYREHRFTALHHDRALGHADRDGFDSFSLGVAAVHVEPSIRP